MRASQSGRGMSADEGRPSSFVARWPELFEGLSDREVAATVRALVATWSDGGLDPEFEDVKALTDVARGVLTREEYWAWARERARVLAAREG